MAGIWPWWTPTGYPVAEGESGELIIGGVGLARYLDPEKDAEKYAPMPTLGWERAYRSGDMVINDHLGLIFVGRVDDQVKIGGRRIELGEIDAALNSLPEVSAAAVAVRETATGNKIPSATCRPTPATTSLRARTALLADLPGPDGADPGGDGQLADEDQRQGGPQRAAVAAARRRAGCRRLRSAPARWHRPVHRRLLEGRARRHGRPDGMRNSSLPAADSLAAAQLVSALRARYPDLTVAELYDYPRFGALVEYLGGQQQSAAPAQPRTVVRTQRGTQWVQSLLAVPLFVLLRVCAGSPI